MISNLSLREAKATKQSSSVSGLLRSARNDDFIIVAVIAALFTAAALFRPLLPIDETRYLTVAWEMFLQQNYFVLSKNFEPYHHKPPLLFWLINLVWSVTGPSRTAAMVPVFITTTAFVFLTRTLGRALFPQQQHTMEKIPLLMLGSLPFLIYGTLMMFDVMLGSIVLAALLLFLSHAAKKHPLKIIAAGLFMGLAVLTKGPVAYLYILPPLLLAPLWMDEKTKRRNLPRWQFHVLAAFLISGIPVLAWLYPTLQETDNQFAFWLVWNQTAGRVTGNFSSAHARPFYFYFIFIPLFLMPWIFFPAFWRNLKPLKKKFMQEPGLKFLACWLLPVFIAFSLISGKQPHYLVPLVPGTIILTALSFHSVKIRPLVITTAAFVLCIIAGQGIASQNLLKAYDLRPIAVYVKSHPDHDWAYVNNYHGEMGFLARMEKPVTDLNLDKLPAWFKDHPNGWAIVRYKEEKNIKGYKVLYSQPYRGKMIAVVRKD